MPDVFKNGSKNKTVTIQTTGQRGGPDVSVGSSCRTRLGHSGRGSSTLTGRYNEMFIKNAGESIIHQEPPWLWFTLPELGFPLLMDQHRRPIHPEIEEYMRWCERCLLITENPKTPGHYRYLIWVLVYIPYTGLAVFIFAISRVPVYTAISNFFQVCVLNASE